ncbi:hypothetical protein BVC80_8959g3 [Macleaya cordata]|uniref:Arabinogalactan peptide n=1 Tax=Macleaya cordata TaxID=56857 RepID=A0A200QWX2_MACCD|nr:hypothetical protein BVC80_8959g3 [Macleaya cordata]
MIFIVAIIYSGIVAVLAQDASSPSPSPSMDKGSAPLGLPISGAFVCSSLLLSLVALLKH